MSRVKGKFIVSHKETWTTGTTKVFNHSFNTSDIVVSMWNLTTGEATLPDSMVTSDDNNITITVSDLPPAGLRVIIIGL